MHKFPYINNLQLPSNAMQILRDQLPSTTTDTSCNSDSITSMTLRTRLIDQSHDGFFHTCLTFVILSKIANTWISNTR